MKKKYKRALAAALAAVMIWNTCDWHPQVLAGSSVPKRVSFGLRQIPIFVTLLLYILIPPVKKNNTSVMVLPQ